MPEWSDYECCPAIPPDAQPALDLDRDLRHFAFPRDGPRHRCAQRVQHLPAAARPWPRSRTSGHDLQPCPGNPTEQISYPDFEYFRQHNHVFTDIAGAPNSIGLVDDFDYEGRDVKLSTRPVSENYFAVLGLRPFLGRLLAPGDDRSKSSIAVMTYSCWRRLGSDRNVVGKVIAGNTIVGVAPKEFTGGFYGFNGDLFNSLGISGTDPSWTRRDGQRLALVARLKPGIERSQAQAEMTALSAQLASAYPQDDKGRYAVVARASLLPPDALVNAQWMTAILLFLALLVLLIACANVSNLLLAVAVARRRQAAIKLALGANRGRLIREFLAESTALCALSGLLGYGIAAAFIGRFSTFSFAFPMYGDFSFSLHLRLDATVIAFALVLTAIASLVTGIAPALYASSPSLAQMLGGEAVAGSVRKGRQRNLLLFAEVAVATMVLVGVGLCLRNIYNLRHADLGFSARNLVTVTLRLQSEGYEAARGKAFYQTLRNSVSAIPGVESVTLASNIPLLGAMPIPVQPPGAGKPISVLHTTVDSDYFATFGIRILAGRVFDSTDHSKSPLVTVINHKMAEEFFPGQDPIGRTISAGEPAADLHRGGRCRQWQVRRYRRVAPPLPVLRAQSGLPGDNRYRRADPRRPQPMGETVGSIAHRARPQGDDLPRNASGLDESHAADAAYRGRLRCRAQRPGASVGGHWLIWRDLLFG